MATLIELAGDAGPLFRLDPVLYPDEQEFRAIYASAKLMEWLTVTLPTLGSTWDIETQPVGQVDALMARYARDEPLTFDWHFKPLNPIGLGVWELKTADIRIFGWFASKDVFIGVVADTKQHIMDVGLYAGYRDEVVRFRNALALNEPKFIPGENPNAVISNYDLPN